MPSYLPMEPGFEIGSDSYIDKRIVLTKEQMITAEDDYFLPDTYFAFCLDDNSWYVYNINNEEAPATGKYRLMPNGLVDDVVVNGVSVVEDKVATLNVIEDVKVDGASVVEDNIANIDGLQKQLTAGQNIKIENDIISVEGLKDPKEGYGIKVGEDGTVSIDTTVVPELASLPTKTSDLQNDSGFIDKAVLNLENYYLKNETYTQQEVNDLISSISGGVTLEVVATLPIVGETNKIYLQRRAIDSNVYDQYVWFNNNWVQVGSTEVNLDNYYTKKEIADLLVTKQDNLTAGIGIALNRNFISVDIGDTLTTTGNKIDVKQATPSQKGVVSYDDNTIKMNSNGQLYSVGGGQGGSYTAGANIQINNNVISATDTTYRAGDGVKITGDVISANTDNQTVFTNAQGQIAIQAVPIDEGSGIKISRDGVISIVPSEVKEALNLDNYQEKLVAGDNITINGNVISSTGGGGSGGTTNWGSIGGTLDNQYDLANRLAGKQNQLVAGANITLTNQGAQTIISATGGSGGSSSFAGLTGSPYDNVPLATALNNKKGVNDPVYASQVQGLAPVATSGDYSSLSNTPVIGNAVISIRQGGSLKGTFNLNDTTNKVIDLDAGGSGSANNGKLTIQRNNVEIGTFSANQATDTSIQIKVPTFSYDSTTGVLTITDN